MKVSFTIIILTILSFLAFGIGPASIGKPAQEFTLENIRTGKSVSLQDYRGKIVIVDFWATWCSPCKEALPELQKLDQENEMVTVLAVNIDNEKENAVKFLEKYDLGITALYDEDKEVVGTYEVPAMPTLVILDKEGIIRYLHIGYTKNHMEDIQKEIEELR